MRKYIWIILLVLCGCNKDNTAKLSEINIQDLVSYIGANGSDVESSFQEELIYNTDDQLCYRLHTDKADYSITFYISSNVISVINVYANLDCTHSEAIALYQSEMDKIDCSGSYCSYIGNYSSASAGIISFSTRSELWSYINANSIAIGTSEIWWIINDTTDKFTIKGEYAKRTNAISIEIERKIWN